MTGVEIRGVMGERGDPRRPKLRPISIPISSAPTILTVGCSPPPNLRTSGGSLLECIANRLIGAIEHTACLC